jgi:hypothetical protein
MFIVSVNAEEAAMAAGGTPPPLTMSEMFESNDTIGASVGKFNERRWAYDHILDLNTRPTLRIRLRKNVFLKTMAIVNVRSDISSTDIRGVEQIFFGIEIRFRGFSTRRIPIEHTEIFRQFPQGSVFST